MRTFGIIKKWRTDDLLSIVCYTYTIDKKITIYNIKICLYKTGRK